jgi:hypothetical protein
VTGTRGPRGRCLREARTSRNEVDEDVAGLTSTHRFAEIAEAGLRSETAAGAADEHGNLKRPVVHSKDTSRQMGNLSISVYALARIYIAKTELVSNGSMGGWFASSARSFASHVRKASTTFL